MGGWCNDYMKDETRLLSHGVTSSSFIIFRLSKGGVTRQKETVPPITSSRCEATLAMLKCHVRHAHVVTHCFHTFVHIQALSQGRSSQQAWHVDPSSAALQRSLTSKLGDSDLLKSLNYGSFRKSNRVFPGVPDIESGFGSTAPGLGLLPSNDKPTTGLLPSSSTHNPGLLPASSLPMTSRLMHASSASPDLLDACTVPKVRFNISLIVRIHI